MCLETAIVDEHYTRAMLTGTRDADGAFPKRYRFRAASDVRARDGLIIPADAWQIDNYLANPVVLAAHDMRGLSIGRATEVVRHEHGLDAELEFDADDPLAQSVMRKLDRGYMSAVSVSFSIGNVDRTSGVVKQATLNEISIVAVPSDPTALMMRGLQALTISTSHSDLSDRFARLEERLIALEARLGEAGDEGPAPEAETVVDIDLTRFATLTRST